MCRWASGGRGAGTAEVVAAAEWALGLAEFEPQAATISEIVPTATARMGGRIDMDCP